MATYLEEINQKVIAITEHHQLSKQALVKYESGTNFVEFLAHSQKVCNVATSWYIIAIS